MNTTHPNWADPTKPWCVIDFDHTDGTRHTFSSGHHLKAGKRFSGFVGIMLRADKECWEEKRKQDIRKLCWYMGAGHVAETAARKGITRVPTILALAAR